MREPDRRVVVDREGIVYTGTEKALVRRGYVDKNTPVSGSAPWSAEKLDGSRAFGFRTRRDAVDWVTGADDGG